MTVPGLVLLSGLDSGQGDRRQRYRLETLFAEWNQELSDGLQSRFQLRRTGSAFGAVLDPEVDVGRSVLHIWKSAHPLRLQVVLAAGPLEPKGAASARPSKELPGVHQFEGPALKRAERELAELANTPYLISSRGRDGDRSARCLRQLGTQLYLRLLEWTPRQLEIYRAYRRAGSQQAAAAALGISQPTVSETLSRIDSPATRAAERHFLDVARRAAGTDESERRRERAGTAGR